ncbi:F-box domain-containing protein [Strongyloides ratti]|uniref:F-box domain-containing protein n=1 Tax=Strongyloides ratti TaxID=34506 RepID=A0A090MV43_STRRB|nr:F-box domain-containing protein [Strongyloides ratti]CEF62633.1 F-box domain-containing protein [Strongyloides ratti]
MLKIFRKDSWKKSSTLKRKNSNNIVFKPLYKRIYSYNILSSTSTITNFNEVSDKCIIEILKRMAFEDILNMKLVNKRLNEIIQRHSNEFVYKKIENFYIIGVNTPGHETIYYPLTTKTLSLPEEDRPSYGFTFQKMYKNLKSISITNSLYMDDVTFSDECYMLVHRLCERSINDLTLKNCLITLNFEKFINILKIFRFKNVILKNCTLEDCQLLGDDLFISNLQLKKFIFNIDRKKNDIIYAPLLSNRTLKAWADNARWPNILSLHGVKSNISYIGISALFHSFHLFSMHMHDQDWWLDEMKKVKCVNWDFGYIRCQLSQILAVSRIYNSWIKYIKKESKQITFTYRYSEKTLPLNFNVKIYM